MPEEVRVIPPLARTLGPPSDVTDDALNVHRRRLGVPGKAVTGRPTGASFFTTSAAVSLAAGIAGWLFVVPTWGFASLVGPIGVLAAIPGLRAPRRVVAGLGLLLNALLTLLLLDWAGVVSWLPGFPTD
jgi:hypothetical protein